MPDLPGVPVHSGFEPYPGMELSAEARQRVLDKWAAVDDARRRAAIAARHYVIG